jgi:Ca2+-binding EF-hand superfamily protein
MNKTKIFSGLLAASLTSAALYAAPALIADGTTKTEAMAKADAMFAKMDVNSDGTINQADRTAKMKAHFAEMDADKNGSINEAEFVAAHEARAEKRDERREMRGERKGPGGHDGHRMGGRGKGGGMKMLAMADANGDKSVTKAEFRTAAEARFAKTDTNKDGSISADERKAQRAEKRGDNWGDRPDMPAPAPADAG